MPNPLSMEDNSRTSTDAQGRKLNSKTTSGVFVDTPQAAHGRRRSLPRPQWKELHFQ